MNLFRNIYYIIPCTFFLLLSIYPIPNTLAQCIPASADICKNANVLCSLDELNGYSCSNPAYSNPTGCTPLCPRGGASQNNAWWAFVTEGGNGIHYI
ncbi:MAG: hypothetical protein IPQ02_13490 [Saprospiraceae bacterium]|nr:hypothetical protein [Candidatus Defluviibacterium haderslevense]